MFSQKHHRFDEEIVKIKRIALLEPLLIPGVYIKNLLISEIIACLLQPFIWRQELIFRVRNNRFNLSRGIHFVIEIEFLDKRLDQSHLIIVVINRKTPLITELFDIPAENACAAGMEGRYPNITRAGSHQPLDALLHLLRRFIRKCNRQNRPRRSPLFNQIGHPVGQYARFARSRACQYKKRALCGNHRFFLRRIKKRQINHSFPPACQEPFRNRPRHTEGSGLPG